MLLQSAIIYYCVYIYIYVLKHLTFSVGSVQVVSSPDFIVLTKFFNISSHPFVLNVFKKKPLGVYKESNCLVLKDKDKQLPVAELLEVFT